MSTSRRVPCLLIAICLCASAIPASAQGPRDTPRCNTPDPGLYSTRDLEFYNPPLADIRAPTIYGQIMPGTDTVPSGGASPSGTTGPGERAHGEGSFGGQIPLVGYMTEGTHEGTCFGAHGLDLHVHGSVHTLVDLGSSSNNVVNSDFQFGVGASFRITHWLSGRLRWMHESTHLGDEFTFEGVRDFDLQRYNVSYESWDLFLALDNEPDAKGRYWRVYGGTRLLVNQAFSSYDREHDGIDASGPLPPLKAANSTEFQGGGELMFGFRPGVTLLGEQLWSGRFFLAGEIFGRDRLDVVAPERTWAKSLGAGYIFGNSLLGESLVELSVRWYSGIHPHGQFRALDKFSYWGVRLGLTP